MTIKGLWTALITPFQNDGTLDREGLRTLIQRQVAAKVDGLLALGTTGESPTLTSEEKIEIAKIFHEECNGKIPIMIGTGTNCTRSTIELTQKLAPFADYSLIVTPYYNKPTQEGLLAHFTEIANQSPLPIVIYDIPGRTNCKPSLETIKTLAAHKNIVAIKDATGDLLQAASLTSTLPLLGGDDTLALPFFSVGAKGLFSVAANLIPEEMRIFTDHALSKNWEAAEKLYQELLPLFRALFIETNPIPIKAVLNARGFPAGPLRLPLTSLSADKTNKILENMEICV